MSGPRLDGDRPKLDIPVTYYREPPNRIYTDMISLPLTGIWFKDIFNTYLKLSSEKHTERSIKIDHSTWMKGTRAGTIFNHSLFERHGIFWLLTPDRVGFNFTSYIGYLPVEDMEIFISLHDSNRYISLEDLKVSRRLWDRLFLTLRGTSYEC